MTGPKTNERPGTRATLKGFHMSASKARVVLNLIRGEDVQSAAEILAGTTREAADVIGKVLASAVANAVNNDGMNADELHVSAAYADEGITMKRFTPRARGRAGKIRKRSCHITVIVSRLDEDRLELLRVARSAQAAASRSRRVASSRRRNEPVPAAQYEPSVDVEENEIVNPAIEIATDETEYEEVVGEANEDETVSEDTTEETK
jgi:large subunit ribosomal protein L22